MLCSWVAPPPHTHIYISTQRYKRMVILCGRYSNNGTWEMFFRRAALEIKYRWGWCWFRLLFCFSYIEEDIFCKGVFFRENVRGTIDEKMERSWLFCCEEFISKNTPSFFISNTTFFYSIICFKKRILEKKSEIIFDDIWMQVHLKI